MSIYRITPLAPAYLLLLGAIVILAVGPALAPRRRHGLAVAVSALAAFSLFFIGSGYSAEVQLVWVLVEWLGAPALALRVPPFEPFLAVLLLSLLAITLAERDVVDRLSAREQAMLFALAATVCGVILAGNYRTLAYALLLFDATAALFALAAKRPRTAVGRLLLGVLSSTAVILLTQGTDYLIAHPGDLGVLFSLTIWLRLGLYPLVESDAPVGSLPPMRLGWTVLNLTVGLYLASAGAGPGLVWLAGAAMVLHGVLAWLEPSREQALAHAGYALAGGILTMTAAVGGGSGSVAASMSILAALVALGLTSPRLGRPDGSHPLGLWAYLPPLLATASLIGIPFTVGWVGRGALYQATWDTGVPGVLALVIVAEGAGLSVLYRYWRRLLSSATAEAGPAGPSATALEGGGVLEGDVALDGDDVPTQSGQGVESLHREGQAEGEVWHVLGATVVTIPILIPVLGPRLLLGVPPSESVPDLNSLNASLGLVGSLLWALFLGYGRPRLLDWIPVSRVTLMSTLRLGWLLRGLGRVLDTLGRGLLRIRAVLEGEHYLAWAILLLLGLGLAILLR
jgi:hypothetical protein